MKDLPIVIAMTGDPSGIGPELCAKAMARGWADANARYALVGSAEAVRRAIATSSLPLTVHAVRQLSEATFQPGRVDVIDPGTLDPGEIVTGEASASCGRAVAEWMSLADELVSGGAAAAAIMGPVSSEALKAAGVVRSIDDLQPPGTFLFRLSGRLRVVALSEHVPLREVAAGITEDRISEALKLTARALEAWGLAAPRIGVAGLNPHGTGTEETERIGPAVEAARQRGLDVAGPLSPDAVFRQCIEGQFDAVLSMYHDQGQIALKTAAFQGACTVYLGYPTLRMSIPQGTAFDIAGQGVADPASMHAAMTVAGRLASGNGFDSAPSREQGA